MRVGVRGPNTENSTRNSTDNARWGTGLTQRISTRNSTDNARWGTGLTQRISTRNSTSNARWGTGPNIGKINSQ